MKILLFTSWWWWGFFAHRQINEAAIYTLPPEMSSFYKVHQAQIVDWAVRPDQRRYAVEGEAPRHFIDWDVYSRAQRDSLVLTPWFQAVERMTEDTLQAYGIVPWHVLYMKKQLTDAFVERNTPRIIQLSAEIGHYIGDANVPLHTTHNYNGQLTNQTGIHGLWESRLPELFSHQYSRWVGRATYLERPDSTIWMAILAAHVALDSVLRFEKSISDNMGWNQKYEITSRNRQTVRAYSYPFSQKYHQLLNGQVERHFKRAIRMVGDFWYTAWVDAGQPDLNTLSPLRVDPHAEKNQMKIWLLNMRRIPGVRPEDAESKP